MSLFALDPGLLDIVLIACAVIFAIAIAFRLVVGNRQGSVENASGPEEASGEPVWEVDSPQQLSGDAYPQTSTNGAASNHRPIDAKMLFTSIAQEEPNAVVSSAEEMLEHLRERSGGPGALTTDQERLAMQFGIIELALNKASYDQSGKSCVLPRETLSEIIREGFRMISSSP
jgi:hypothetical protein